MKQKRSTNSQSGFTLVEMICVIAILGNPGCGGSSGLQ